MKRALTALGILAGLALLAAPVSAQSGGARGKVTDDKGQPVAEATVRIEYTGGIPRTYEVTTNAKGEYVQIGLQTGSYRFTASKEGYVDATLDIKVGLGMATQIPTLELIAKAAAQGPDAAVLKEKFAEGTELAREGLAQARRSSERCRPREGRGRSRSDGAERVASRSATPADTLLWPVAEYPTTEP